MNSETGGVFQGRPGCRDGRLSEVKERKTLEGRYEELHLTLFVFPLVLMVMETGRRANCW